MGLLTALAILEHTQAKVTIVAEHNPEKQPYLPHYTLPWAGAHFRPFPAQNQAQLREYPFSRATYRRFLRLAKENPESSVKFVEGIDYLEEDVLAYRDLHEGYSEELEDFERIPQNQLPKGISLGFRYKTFVLDAPLYLQFLARRLRIKYGVRFVEEKLENLQSAARFGGIIINCSGSGLQWEGGDDKDSFPIRGQTVLVRSGLSEDKTVTIQHKNGDWTFCIPRPLGGGIVVGGTKQVGDWCTDVRGEEVDAVLGRAQKFLLPDLPENKWDVVRVNVGFRPGRHGGMNVSLDRSHGVPVVHAYGAAGSGFEFSYGVGLKVLLLLRESKL